ncbi:MAG: bifunctional 3,4-dihydroxy-2-butanone-4-phosphate synthase/GTP cyclohydrolase II [Gammaproteobacteria bacterium]|nr:bifunctional 3,4-dihydroxy-2-butanone-4-phosphate synthase/GTP cyclohydrolase II [Gammaproteobacteria bacterium]
MVTQAKNESAWSGLNSTEEIIADLRDGKMVIIMDDEDRENEGDLIMAASKVNSEDINFMARYGRGLICLTLTGDRCEQLRLPLMVSDTERNRDTNFTVSIEAAEGITTGISAHDRACTIRAAVAREARPDDLRQPGHVFPLKAQSGGVLSRAGHTEAGCDLTRLAGFEPAAAIVEILNEDGTMARRDDLLRFASQHDLKIGSIAELISYRLSKEESVEAIAEQTVDTDFGPFRLVCMEDHINRTVHLALVRGEPNADTPTLVRVHIQDTLSDVIGIKDSKLGWPLRDAMQLIAEEGCGVVVILRQEELPKNLMQAFRGLQEKQDEFLIGRDHTAELKTYGTGAQILRSLGVQKMRVLSAPKNMYAISGFGLEIVEYISSEGSSVKDDVK